MTDKRDDLKEKFLKDRKKETITLHERVNLENIIRVLKQENNDLNKLVKELTTYIEELKQENNNLKLVKLELLNAVLTIKKRNKKNIKRYN